MSHLKSHICVIRVSACNNNNNNYTLFERVLLYQRLFVCTLNVNFDRLNGFHISKVSGPMSNPVRASSRLLLSHGMISLPHFIDAM